MVDRERLLELVPHYIAMMVVWFALLTLVRAIMGTESVGFWIEMGLLAVVAFSYQPAVRRLGIAPRMWEKG